MTLDIYILSKPYPHIKISNKLYEMTRINIVSVHQLFDQHLIAEYREILMVPAALKRTLNSKTGLDQSKISKTYTLNSGHVYFFYDKGQYLCKRYKEIIDEMKRRGFKPNLSRKFPKDIFLKNNLYNDWTPQPEELEIIKKRIKSKIKQKPHWYRKTL
tara:strand:+ start:33 stop:506 length:474 start_codon:yes stop_codon:yes gene_type:complete